MADQRILIAGVSGFIGSALARELPGGGYEVVGLTRRAGAVRAGRSGPLTLAEWDGRSAAGWGHLAEGALAVVNLAGESLAGGRWTRAKKERILRSRVEAGAALVEAVRLARIRPRALVQASAIGAYALAGEEEPAEKSPAAGTGFLAEVVRQWEDSTRPVETLGVRRVVVRSGLVFGTGGGVWPRLVKPFRLLAGGPLGSGRQWLSWITAEDEVRALRFLIEHDELAGTFDLAAPQPIRQRELCKIIGKALRKPCWLPVPAFLLELLFGEMARETLLAGQRVVPRRLVASGFRFLHSDAASAVTAILK
jgi:hypothetical protein